MTPPVLGQGKMLLEGVYVVTNWVILPDIVDSLGLLSLILGQPELQREKQLWGRVSSLLPLLSLVRLLKQMV